MRANLAKHKQKVTLLKEELEKEQFYVEYLERLLSDVEQHKRKLAKEKVISDDTPQSDLGVVSRLGGEDVLSKVNIYVGLVSVLFILRKYCCKVVTLWLPL